ncbi:MAG: hypothetical protein JXR63_05075 [Spirochaetales bacterium]|nr:hypothetical protein [Spirochaetales bacterium]
MKILTKMFAIMLLVGCTGQVANIPELKGSGKGILGVQNPYEEYIDGEALSEVLSKKGLIVYPFSRNQTMLPNHGIPTVWANQEVTALEVVSQPGEYLVFQTGVISDKAVENIDFSIDFVGNQNNLMKETFTCFNTEGVNFLGNDFEKNLNLEVGKPEVFIFGMETPTSSNDYKAVVTLRSGNQTLASYDLTIKIKGEAVNDFGESSPENLTRLKWLNSRIGFTDQPCDPYTAIEVDGNSVKILGREVVIGNSGLVENIFSYFNESNTRVDAQRSIITNSFEFVIGDEKLNIEKNAVVKKLNDSSAYWEATHSSANFKLIITGTVEYDGFIAIDYQVEAKNNAKVADISLKIPFDNDSMKYILGMDKTGQSVNFDEYEWKWNTEKHQDAVWLGNVNKGMTIRLKGANFKRPLVNAYYKYSPLNLPDSWGNGNNGGVKIINKSTEKYFLAYSGEREIKKGEKLHFITDLYVTPFKPIDISKQWKDRYLHIVPGGAGGRMPDVARAKKIGANVINIHHNRLINPFINYPYNHLSLADSKEFINDAHNNGMKVKFYYTTREVTSSMYEFVPLYWLDGEIIHKRDPEAGWPVTNPTGANPLLTNLLKDDFIPAWRETLQGKYKGLLDLAVITTPDSRWNNFFLEGLNYFAKETGFDGIYIDDTALDRTSIQRARKILKKNNSEALIDTHSWNHYNEYAGFSNCAIVFMELLPYYDRLWFGEAFDYETTGDDFFMTEMAGIPFGLTSEMLQEGGNIWRGMVYGMTNRKGWHGPKFYEPQNIWKLLDDFGTDNVDMCGYWDSANPVDTQNSSVKATVFTNDKKIMIAFASWADSDVSITPEIDWAKLGINPTTAKIYFPSIFGFQSGSKANNQLKIKIPKNKGKILIIEK